MIKWITKVHKSGPDQFRSRSLLGTGWESGMHLMLSVWPVCPRWHTNIFCFLYIYFFLWRKGGGVHITHVVSHCFFTVTNNSFLKCFVSLFCVCKKSIHAHLPKQAKTIMMIPYKCLFVDLHGVKTICPDWYTVGSYFDLIYNHAQVFHNKQ